jgi:hypothetical protein
MTALRLACYTFVALVAVPGGAVEPPHQVHGSADAYTAPGVTLAWGVLRGANEAATIIVMRIVTDPQVYPGIAARGSNPFSPRQQALLPPTQSSGSVDVRVPRAHFADFPRTELSFYGSASALHSETPQLVVYYLGVPDTTPEFASESDLAGYLSDRIARLRATGSKAP